MDWGVAKHREEPPATASGDAPPPGPASDHDTAHGTVLGTPAYMAPEQARGEIERVDARADVYALGAILLLPPHRPRPGTDEGRTGRAHADLGRARLGRPPSSRLAASPPASRARSRRSALKALAPDPDGPLREASTTSAADVGRFLEGREGRGLPGERLAEGPPLRRPAPDGHRPRPGLPRHAGRPARRRPHLTDVPDPRGPAAKGTAGRRVRTGAGTTHFRRGGRPMNKPLLGLVVGGVLGVFDGLSALLSAPEVAPQILGIIIGSTVQGHDRRRDRRLRGPQGELGAHRGSPSASRRASSSPGSSPPCPIPSHREALLLGDHAPGQPRRRPRRLGHPAVRPPARRGPRLRRPQRSGPASGIEAGS